MRQAFTIEDALPLAQKIAGAIAVSKDDITALDAEIGDGDLGVTCDRGTEAVVELLQDAGGMSGSEMLMKAGMTFNSAGASTFGALVATACMRASKYAKDNDIDTWDVAAIAEAMEVAAEGIQQRGEAARGDKTLLDALWPAIEALHGAAAADTDLPDALHDAAEAAARGAEDTKPMKAKLGRAAWMQDRTIGVKDAGAAVTAIVIRAIADYAAGE
jgi:dihydroxyacetone kinase-like protein